MINHINNFSANYFSPIIEGKKDNKPNAWLKIASYITVVIPAVIALAWGAAKLVDRAIKWITSNHNESVSTVHRVAQERFGSNINIEQFVKDTIDAMGMVNKAKVEDEASVLIDSESFPEESLEFMRKTKLSEIEYAEINDLTFDVINKSTKERINFSNRVPNSGELRSGILREKLNQKRREKGGEDKTLYEAISELIRDPKESQYSSYYRRAYLDDFGKTTIEGFSIAIFDILQKGEDVDLERGKEILQKFRKDV